MQLTPHPSTPLPTGWGLAAHCGAVLDTLELVWLLRAATAAIRVPPPREPAHRDGLWRSTCFELFVADPAGAGYREFNFAPSAEWAAYAFTAYRQGMVTLALPARPAIEVQIVADALQLRARLPRAALGLLPNERGARRRCALAAVIEQVDGTLSYLALAHPAGRPDFHDPVGFVEMVLP